jgi:hypothetical protein
MMPSRASHLSIITVHIPMQLKVEAADMIGINRELPHIPTPILEEALAWLCPAGRNDTGTGNFSPLPEGEGCDLAGEYAFVYVNDVPISRGGDPVTAARCKVHHACLVYGKNPINCRTIRSWRKSCQSLHEVCIALHNDTESNHETLGHSCDCETFWIMRTCPHLLATLDFLKEPGVDVQRSCKDAFMPNKGKGRPRRVRASTQARLKGPC